MSTIGPYQCTFAFTCGGLYARLLYVINLPTCPTVARAMASVLVSAGEVEYVRRGFEAGVRGDGRGPLDFRQIEIETGVIAQATGSARVRLGTTDVLVGVKARHPLGWVQGYSGLALPVHLLACRLKPPAGSLMTGGGWPTSRGRAQPGQDILCDGVLPHSQPQLPGAGRGGARLGPHRHAPAHILPQPRQRE